MLILNSFEKWTKRLALSPQIGAKSEVNSEWTSSN